LGSEIDRERKDFEGKASVANSIPVEEGVCEFSILVRNDCSQNE